MEFLVEATSIAYRFPCLISSPQSCRLRFTVHTACSFSPRGRLKNKTDQRFSLFEVGAIKDFVVVVFNSHEQEAVTFCLEECGVACAPRVSLSLGKLINQVKNFLMACSSLRGRESLSH